MVRILNKDENVHRYEVSRREKRRTNTTLAYDKLSVDIDHVYLGINQSLYLEI